MTKQSFCVSTLTILLLFVSLCSGAGYAGTQSSPSRYRPDSSTQSQGRYVPKIEDINDMSCDEAHIIDALENQGTPETWDEMRELLRHNKDAYREQWKLFSIWHNFQPWVDKIPYAAGDMKGAQFREAIFRYAVYEYLIEPREKWFVLDPDFPNIKYVSEDGHKEVVYNRHTGKKVNSGINQGTANASSGKIGKAHLSDIVRAVKCGTSSKEHQELAKRILEYDGVPEEIKEKVKRLFIREETCQTPIDQQICTSEDVEKSEDEQTDSEVDNHKIADNDADIGVKGWCKCGANHGKIFTLGYGPLLDLKNDGSKFAANMGDYFYRLCGRCGKIFKPSRKIGERGEAEIIDTHIYNQYFEQAGASIPLPQYHAMLCQSEDKLLSIPDGQIVIPGKCTCKEPDPIKTGFVDNEEFFVCIFCGRVRLPEDSSIPMGPTLWRENMGNDKPFPGY
jgi:hypothetical protein